MSEDIEAVFNNGCPTLTDNWLEELKRHNERAKALRALGSAHCIIDRRTRKPEV